MSRTVNIVLVIVLALGVLALPPLYHYSRGNLTFKPLPPETKTDAVMVFTGTSERIVRGYQHYLLGRSRKIMISGFDYPEWINVPRVKNLSQKVRKDRVYIDLKARNTIENAKNGAEWAMKNNIDSILLVTTETHLPRAYFELRRLLPESVKIYTSAVSAEEEFQGLESETGSLICRLYETATGTQFCYGTRDFLQTLEAHLLPGDAEDDGPGLIADVPLLGFPTRVLTDLSDNII